MSERFLIRTDGGPTPGTRSVFESATWTWPLPARLPGLGGVYVKVRESGLPPQPEGSRVVRGAEYEWRQAS